MRILTDVMNQGVKYEPELDSRGWLVAALVEDGRDPALVALLHLIYSDHGPGQARADLVTINKF